MTGARKLRRGGAIALTIVAVATVLAMWASPALAAGTPGAVPGLASTTHPDPAAWYPVVNATFLWSPATESGGTIAGYSFAFDQSASTVPPVTSGAALSYLARVNYAVGSGPAEDRVADLNGDGKLDIVAENAGANTVSVLLGNGDGTFRAAVSYATDTNPWSLQVGDVSGDGKLDIVTANESASTVSVLLGNGDGTFKAAVNYTTGTGTSPECMRLGDLTGDGRPDIITANAGTNNISVLKNNGDGTFAAPVTYSTATHPTSIAIGDLNGDGKQDVVTANYATNNVSVLIGNGDATFKTAVNYTCGATPQTVELADCNGDSKLDIVTANYNSTASVLINNGNGTFATNVDYATGSGPYSLSLADLNHDGHVDIVTVNHSANDVSVLLGNGDGTFATHADYATGNGPFWVALGDFNHDGYGDIAATNETDGTVSVLLGSGYYRPASGKLSASFNGLTDGTWYLHVRAVDTAGVAGPTSTCQVNVDTVAPTTSASGLQASGSTGWTNTQTVTLTASDALSHVSATYYAVDGTQHTYSGPFQVSTAGSHTITYWSVDKAGNTETAHTGYVNIDLTAPVTAAGTNPSDWTNGAVQVTLSASDQGGSGLAGTSYQVGSGPVHAYSGPFTVSDATPVTYWSTDKAGNAEAQGTLVPKIDTVAPVTTATTDPAGWTNGSVQVTLSASDQGGSGLAATSYQIGSGPVHTYSGPLIVSDASTITYWSTDNTGNEETHHTLTPQIDTVAPATTATTDPSGWTNGAVRVTLSASDAGGSGLDTTYYRIGSGDPQTYDQPFDVSSAAAVTYWSTDKAGNEESHHTLTPQIDKVAPATTATTDPSGWTKGDVKITLAATDQGGSDVAATNYRIGSGNPQTYDQPFEVSDATTVTYWSTDNAGNEESHHSLTPQIDKVAPVTTATTDPDAWTNRAVTVTLSASDQGGSDVAATCYRIGDGDVQTYDKPFSVSDPTTVTYWSMDNAGNEESHQSLTPQIDRTAPATTASTDPSGWTNSLVTVTLSAKDEGGSDVAATYYKIGDAQAQTYDQPFTVSDATPVTYWSTDNAGNEEAHQTLTPQIETVAPTTAAATDPSGWTNGPVQVTLTAKDEGGSGVAGTSYQVGDGAVQAYDQPFTVSDATPVTYWSTDNAGNVEQHQRLTPNIDTQAPVVADDVASGWQRTDQKVTITASDDGGSGLDALHCTLDGVDQQLAAGGGSFTVSGNGTHTITYSATDAAGNESAPVTKELRIDATAPTTSSTTDPSGWTKDAVQVTLTAHDEGGSDVAATYYRIGDGDVQTYSAPFTVSDATPITYWSADNAGNVEDETGNSLTPQIDTVAPVTTSAELTAAPGTAWQPGAVDVTLDAGDAGSGVAATYYQVDGRGMQPYTGSFKVSGDGDHEVDFYSVDKAGNAEDPFEKGYVDIDSTPPTITATGLQAGPHTGWQKTDQQVSIDASDAGSGVAAVAYTIDGIAQPAYAQPFTVSGDGSHAVTCTAIDNAGNVASGDGWIDIDTTAPTTTASTNLVAAPDTGFVLEAQQISLTAIDAGCGCAHTVYTVDGGTPTDYMQPFTVAGVGSHEVTYYSVDELGNREDTRTGYVNIGPAEALITAAAGLAPDAHTGWTASPVSVTLTANHADLKSGAYSVATHYRVDGGDWQTYDRAFSISAPGSHRVDYYSTDSLHATEQTNTGYVNIDTTAPVTKATASVRPQRTATVVRLDATDAQSGVSSIVYRLDTQAPKTGTTASVNVIVPAPSNHSKDGVHTITYYSVDQAGNVEAPHVVKVRIDTTRPAFTLRSAKRVTVHRGRSLALRLRARDAGGTCKLVVTLSRKVGKHVVKYTSTLSTRHVTSWQTTKLRLARPRGTYAAVLRLVDPAGNLSAAQTIRVTIK